MESQSLACGVAPAAAFVGSLGSAFNARALLRPRAFLRASRRSRRPSPLCADSSLAAVEHSTGRALLLTNEGAASAIPNVSLYIRCEKCTHCYRVSSASVIEGAALRCTNCGSTWTAKSADLLCEFDESAPAPSAVRPDEINCRHFDECSGCVLNKEVDNPPVMSELRRLVHSLSKLNGEKIPVVFNQSTQWRTTAKLAVRRNRPPSGRGRRPAKNASGVPIVGLYKEKSHDVVAIPDCEVHHPSINAAVRVLQEEIVRCKVRAYDEDTGEGHLRYIQAVVERASGLVQMTLVWNAATLKETLPMSTYLTKGLWNRKKEAHLHSIWLNFNNSIGNAILKLEPHRWVLVRGPAYVKESVCDVEFEFAPYTFRQGNLDAFEELVKSMAKFVPTESHVVEYCAGIGVIGLGLLKKRALEKITITESNSLAEESFGKALRSLGPELRERASFETGTMNQLRDLALEANVIVADPPRGGLDDGLLAKLCQLGHQSSSAGEAIAYRQSAGSPTGQRAVKPNAKASVPREAASRRFLYLSCGFESLKRDAAMLQAAGWRVSAVEAGIFFPGADHVETLMVFEL